MQPTEWAGSRAARVPRPHTCTGMRTRVSAPCAHTEYIVSPPYVDRNSYFATSFDCITPFDPVRRARRTLPPTLAQVKQLPATEPIQHISYFNRLYEKMDISLLLLTLQRPNNPKEKKPKLSIVTSSGDYRLASSRSKHFPRTTSGRRK